VNRACANSKLLNVCQHVDWGQNDEMKMKEKI